MATATSTTSDPVVGPLTTPFVPPSFCTSVFGFELGVTCTGDSYNRASACFPNSPSYFGGLGYFSSVYSPGIACPVGWTSESQSLSTVTCCPSSFRVSGGSCISTKTVTPGYNDVYTCSGSTPSAISYTFSSSSATITALAIQVRVILDPTDTFTSFDGSIISSRVSSSARLVSSSSTGSSTGGTLIAEPEPGPKKLSGGAIAGIVIGTLAFFALIIGAVVFFLRRRNQQKDHGTFTSGPYGAGDLPELVSPGPQVYANSSPRHSQTKIPPVNSEKTNTPSLRTAVSPVPTTPTQTDRNELFFTNHANNRVSEVSELASPQMHQHGNRDTYTTTSSATYPRSPLSELASFETPHQPTINHSVSPVYASNSIGQEPEYQPTERDSQVARLEAEKAMLDKLKARQLAQIEQEQASLQAELERLRGLR